MAYRDHTKEQVRDIAVTRLENGHWTPGKIVSPDHWVLDACPTNAAAVEAKGDHVAVSWFTAAAGKPRVEMAFSNDAGSSFTKATVLSTGQAFGYTALAMEDDGGAIVSWLERSPEGAKVMVRRVTAAGVAGPAIEVAKGGKSALGYPKIFHHGSETFIAWGGPGQRVETASLTAK